MNSPEPALGPWNPGIRSPVPRDIEPLSTLYRPENTRLTVDEVRELADFTGLPAVSLVSFRAARLVTHDVLIRLVGDVSIADGPGSEDLGIGFRAMASRIEEHYIKPHLPALEVELDRLQENLVNETLDALKALDAAVPPPPHPRGWMERLGLAKAEPAAPPGLSADERETQAIASFQAMQLASIESTRILGRSQRRNTPYHRMRHRQKDACSSSRQAPGHHPLSNHQH
jgi:hypothetical protein